MQGLAEYPAAFVGTFISKTSLSDFEAVYTFEVEQWVKGDFGGDHRGRAHAQGSACGYEFSPGERMASFLDFSDGAPAGGLCHTVDPDVLLQASQPVIFNGTGPPHLLVAGPFTEGTHLVLDADGGLLLPLGEPPGESDMLDRPRSFSLCPGGELLVEEWSWRLDIRDLATLEIVSTVDLHGFADHVGIVDLGVSRGGRFEHSVAWRPRFGRRRGVRGGARTDPIVRGSVLRRRPGVDGRRAA